MRILIIENNKADYDHLSALLQEVSPGCEIIPPCTSVKETKKWFRDHRLPDLVFSVINLPDGLSFEIFRKLGKNIPVIFTCRQEKYALGAFKTSAIFYIIKPIKKSDLLEAIRKYRHIRQQKAEIPEGTYQKRFLVHLGKQMKVIPAEDIAYFYTSNKVVYLVDRNGSKFNTRFKLEDLEKILDPGSFFRINRQFIIRFSSITKMVPASKSRLQVVLQPKTNQETITSSGRMDSFYRWILQGHA